MKIKNYVLCMLAMLTLSFMNCDDGDNGNDAAVIDNGENPLLGTSWKLVGVVDENGTLREFEPTDCERCYIITFDSVATPCFGYHWPDPSCPNMPLATFTDYSHANRGCGAYCANNLTHEFSIAYFATTAAGSIYDDDRLWHAIIRATMSFSLHEDVLKLNYDGNKYMLFEPYSEN